MSRPFVVIFLFYLTGIYLGSMNGIIGLPGIILCLGLLGVFRILWGNSRFSSLSSWLILIACLFLGMMRYQSASQSINREIEICRSLFTPSSVVISGKITQNPVFSKNRITYLLKEVKIQTPTEVVPIKQKFLLDIRKPKPGLDLLYGDRIIYEGRVMLPSPPRNPGAFDYGRYLKQNGIAGLSRIKPNEIIEISYTPGFWESLLDSPLRLSSWLKIALIRINNQLIPYPYNSIANGISLGIQSEIPDDVKDIYYYGGIYHLLVVSGGNIMLVAVMVFFILKLFHLNRRMSLLGSLPAIILYSMVVGFSPPVTRALIMSTLLIMGGFIKRDIQPLNSLALGGLAILWMNPLSLWDGSFQLSFMAVFGLITLTPIFNEYLPIENRFLRISLISSLSPLLATLPILVKYFNYLSTVSLLSNLIAAPMVFLSLPLTFLTGIAYPISQSLASAFAQCNGVSIFLMTELTRLLTLLPGAYFNFPDIPAWMMAVYYILLVGFISAFQPSIGFPDYAFRKRWLTSSLVAGLVLGSFIIMDLNVTRFQAAFLDVGEGDCILLRFPNRKTVLVDGGRGSPYDYGKRVVLPYLRKAGIRRVDVMVVTHPDEDHAGGMVSVLNEYPVDNILLSTLESPQDSSYEKILAIAHQKNIPVRLCVRGDEIAGFEPWRLEIMNPSSSPLKGTGSDENNNSVVLRVWKGNQSLLFTGDIGLEAESELVKSGVSLNAQVLKVSHHGSRFSSSDGFLEAVHPDLAIIQVGNMNVFDHPSPETISRLTSRNIKIYRTDKNGAVILEETPQGWKVKPWLYFINPN